MLFLALSVQIKELHTGVELKTFLNDNEYVFLKFFMDTCGHCHHLAPRFIDLEDMSPQAKLAEFNCNTDNSVCNEYEVNGVPTLLLFKNGKQIGEYESEYRDPKPMNKWISKTISEQNKTEM
ncbi:Thioredoxin_domain-containing protein [Hexamita inflata]|uniref:Thioredoxin domain-containing protein n=1 Tax=Hexamita inflata TaxID=28002 RepID=A0AA86PYJ2_9EUKA|nr:Thioredoxin domain-containing protein [Hexamita inflata]